jgi:hypothetical protein
MLAPENLFRVPWGFHHLCTFPSHVLCRGVMYWPVKNEILLNKYEKLPASSRQERRSVPLNAALNGLELSWQCSIFTQEQSEHCRLTARVDRYFLFGNAMFLLLAPGCSSFPSRLGTAQVSRCPALVYINHLLVRLGSMTHLGSSGISPGTLSPWVGGGMEMPYYVVLQVSNHLDLLNISSAHVGDPEGVYVSPVHMVFDSPPGGGSKHKNCDYA